MKHIKNNKRKFKNFIVLNDKRENNNLIDFNFKIN